MNEFIGIITIIGIIAFIGHKVYNVYHIDKYGFLTKARIEFVKYLSSNDGGSTNIAFILLADIGGKEVLLKGTKSIPTFYASQLMPGEYIDIKYLDEKHFLFVYKEQGN